MDEQNGARIEQLLEDTLELAQENNELLHTLQRNARFAFWGKLLLWVIILGVPLLFIGPFIKAILPVAYSENQPPSLLGLPSPEQVKALMETYRAASGASATTTP